MPVSNWKRLDAYVPVVRLIAAFARQQDPTPLPVEVRTLLGISRSMWQAWSEHQGETTPPPGMTISHAVSIARYIGQPVQAVLAVAGLRPDEDPLFDRAGAWTYVLGTVERLGAQGHLASDMSTALTHQLAWAAAIDLGYAVAHALDHTRGWTDDQWVRGPSGAPGAPRLPEWELRADDSNRSGVPQSADETSAASEADSARTAATGVGSEERLAAARFTGAANGDDHTEDDGDHEDGGNREMSGEHTELAESVQTTPPTPMTSARERGKGRERQATP